MYIRYMFKAINTDDNLCFTKIQQVIMRIRRKTTLKVSRARVREIILNSEPALTAQMVEKYTDSELREWMRHLHLNGTLV